MRWRKGTNDQDGDGRKGGSLPEETNMATKTKAAARPAAKKVPVIKADGQNQMNTAAAAQSEAVQAKEGSAHTPQTGMEPGLSPKEERARLNEQFAEADEKGKAAIIDETQVGLQVRGY